MDFINTIKETSEFSCIRRESIESITLSIYEDKTWGGSTGYKVSTIATISGKPHTLNVEQSKSEKDAVEASCMWLKDRQLPVPAIPAEYKWREANYREPTEQEAQEMMRFGAGAYK